MPSEDSSHKIELTVAARNSALSRAQVVEVYEELIQFHPAVKFHPIWFETTGDRDLTTSLRTLDKTDFFTREIDLFQLVGGCRISIHSAKDLPEPLAKGLCLVALTRGRDASDALVLREKDSLQTLALGALIGTSSVRREKAIRYLREDLRCVDIRGTIERRLSLLDEREVDGVVVAEAALLRLKLHARRRIKLPGESAPLQGRLAVIAREEDIEMKELFACINEENSLSRDGRRAF